MVDLKKKFEKDFEEAVDIIDYYVNMVNDGLELSNEQKKHLSEVVSWLEEKKDADDRIEKWLKIGKDILYVGKPTLDEGKLISIINESISEVISEMKLTPQQLAYLSGKAHGLSKDTSKSVKYRTRKENQANRFGLGVEFHPDSIKRNNGDSGYEYDYFQPYVNDMDSKENPIVVKRFQYNINPDAQILTKDRYKNGPDDGNVYNAKSVDRAVNGGYEKSNDAFKAGRQNATRNYELEKALFKSLGDEKF